MPGWQDYVVEPMTQLLTLIAEGVGAVEMAAVTEDLANCIHPHPSLSESIGIAAEIYMGTATDLYIPKKK